MVASYSYQHFRGRVGCGTESLGGHLAASAIPEAAFSRVTSTVKSCDCPKSRGSCKLPQTPMAGSPSRFPLEWGLPPPPVLLPSAEDGAPGHSGSGQIPLPRISESTSWAIGGRRCPFCSPHLSLTTPQGAGLGDGVEGRKPTKPFTAGITNISRR